MKEDEARIKQPKPTIRRRRAPSICIRLDRRRRCSILPLDGQRRKRRRGVNRCGERFRSSHAPAVRVLLGRARRDDKAAFECSWGGQLDILPCGGGILQSALYHRQESGVDDSLTVSLPFGCTPRRRCWMVCPRMCSSCWSACITAAIPIPLWRSLPPKRVSWSNRTCECVRGVQTTHKRSRDKIDIGFSPVSRV